MKILYFVSIFYELGRVYQLIWTFQTGKHSDKKRAKDYKVTQNVRGVLEANAYEKFDYEYNQRI